MKKENKDNRSGFSSFLRYLKGEMKGKERNSLERELQRDPFAEEAVEGLASISPDNADTDIRKLKSMLDRRTRRRRKNTIYRIAASVAVLMIISSVFLVVENRSRKQVTIPSGERAEFEIARNEPLTQPDEQKAGTRTQVDVERVVESAREVTEHAKQEEAPLTEEKPEDGKTEAEQNKKTGQNAFAAEKVPEKPAVIAGDKAFNRIAMAPAAASKSKNLRSGEKPVVNKASGVVISSEDNLPVGGASVVIKGTNTGAVTDAGGNFSISLPEPDKNVTLVASFIGMTTQELEVSPGDPLKIVLQPDARALSEVVVVGYGVKHGDYEAAETGYSAPRPANGKAAFDKYILENIRRPDTATAGQRVVVVAGFRVLTDGSLDSIRIIRSPGKRFSDEAIRLIKSGPAWKPAELDGSIIEDNVRLRIVFR